ncbi:MAG: SpoIID/LytB domain-containing protein [Planctomycetes bacterium]|nr:SpoIID/LytB domain-containing protein [Planctomycetota bacterium]
MNHARTLRYLLAGGTAAFLALLFSCRELPTREDAVLAAFPKSIPNAPEIRVLVLQDVSEVKLAVHGRFQLKTEDGRVIPNRNRNLGEVSVKAMSGGIALGVQSFRTETITVAPVDSGSLYINDMPWPGEVTFMRSGLPLHFDVINTVNLEVYLCGVIAGETPWRSWPGETLKAQAVASRTYALHAHLTAVRAGRPYDVVSTHMSQVFKPGVIDQPVISRAVNATRGQVLTYQEKIFPAYFSAACGGHTEDSSKVFGDLKVAPLSGVDCPFCRAGGSKYDSWEAEIPTDILTRRLKLVAQKEFGRQLGQVRMVEPVGTGVSKRVTSVRIINALEPMTMNSNVFRLAVGPKELPSTFFVVEAAGRNVLRFKGKGWGHGVGMCQFGAEQAGRASWSYFEILAWYYKGARLTLLPYAAGKGHRDTAMEPQPADGAR